MSLFVTLFIYNFGAPFPSPQARTNEKLFGIRQKRAKEAAEDPEGAAKAKEKAIAAKKAKKAKK